MSSSDSTLKIVPYGIANFEEIRTEDYAYVDKTAFIESLEKAKLKYPFIIRPRRFGKTLFSETLTAYYDKAAAPRFDNYFAGTYIARHKSVLANSYYVINFDFSGISTGDNLEFNFTHSVLERIGEFFDRYPISGFKDFLTDCRAYQEPAALILAFFNFVRPTVKHNLFVIIDEYDQFANNLLSADRALFQKITTTDGFLKAFYSQLKRGTGRAGVVAKIYITGVTSIALDSMSSGYSIGQNISSDAGFASLFGFTEAELRELIPQVIDFKQSPMSLEAVIYRLRELYNGYRFTPYSNESVFNSSMCLYYLDWIQKHNREPDQFMDPSVSQDTSKIHGILQLGRLEDIRDIVEKAVRREPIEFTDRPDLLSLQPNGLFSKDKILSALVYMGFLTYAPGETSRLIVPNRVMMQQFVDTYFTYLRRYDFWQTMTASRFAEAVTALASGNPRRLVERISEILSAGCGARSFLNIEEKDFHWALLIGANFAPGYDVFVEHEVRGVDKGFVDLLMVSKTSAPSYLFELKHLKKSSVTPTAVQNKLQEARSQADRYAEGLNIRSIPNLKKVAVVFGGFDVKAMDVWQ